MVNGWTDADKSHMDTPSTNQSGHPSMEETQTFEQDRSLTKEARTNTNIGASQK